MKMDDYEKTKEESKIPLIKQYTKERVSSVLINTVFCEWMNGNIESFEQCLLQTVILLSKQNSHLMQTMVEMKWKTNQPFKT